MMVMLHPVLRPSLNRLVIRLTLSFVGPFFMDTGFLVGSSLALLFPRVDLQHSSKLLRRQLSMPPQNVQRVCESTTGQLDLAALP